MRCLRQINFHVEQVLRGSIPSRQCTEVFGTRLNVSQMSWVVHFSSHQKGNFCPSCGNILEIPGVSDDVVCNVCGYSCLVDGLYLQVFVRVTCTDLNIKEIVTKSRAFSKQNKRTATKTEDHGATVSFFGLVTLIYGGARRMPFLRQLGNVLQNCTTPLR